MQTLKAITRLVAACVVLGVFPVSIASHADEVQVTEYQVKATLLCKFGNYVDWPYMPAGGQFHIGVVASEAIAADVTRAARGRTVNGAPIVVRKLSHGELVDLGIVFIARTHATRATEVLAAARERPILTVTETEEGSNLGGMVNFVTVDDKVKFDIALRAVEGSNIKISSRLLTVARVVQGKDW